MVTAQRFPLNPVDSSSSSQHHARRSIFDQQSCSQGAQRTLSRSLTSKSDPEKKGSDLHLMYFLAQMNIGVILVLGVKSEADLDFMQQEETDVSSEGSVKESRSS